MSTDPNGRDQIKQMEEDEGRRFKYLDDATDELDREAEHLDELITEAAEAEQRVRASEQEYARKSGIPNF
jgi:hypothetical protein